MQQGDSRRTGSIGSEKSRIQRSLNAVRHRYPLDSHFRVLVIPTVICSPREKVISLPESRARARARELSRSKERRKPERETLRAHSRSLTTLLHAPPPPALSRPGDAYLHPCRSVQQRLRRLTILQAFLDIPVEAAPQKPQQKQPARRNPLPPLPSPVPARLRQGRAMCLRRIASFLETVDAVAPKRRSETTSSTPSR